MLLIRHQYKDMISGKAEKRYLHHPLAFSTTAHNLHPPQKKAYMRTDYTIQAATPADVPTIHALADAIWEPTYSSILSKEQIDYMFEVIYAEEALQQQLQEGQTFLLLKDEAGTAVGFSAYSVKDQKEKVYKLNKIYLLPECQGKGLGYKLLAATEDEVRHKGAAVLDLNVNRYNKAKQFYERCGYYVHQEEDIAIGPYWMNDYVMRKKL